MPSLTHFHFYDFYSFIPFYSLLILATVCSFYLVFYCIYLESALECQKGAYKSNIIIKLTSSVCDGLNVAGIFLGGCVGVGNKRHCHGGRWKNVFSRDSSPPSV